MVYPTESESLQMPTPASELYSRTLSKWLKSDDKALLAAVADGQTVFEVATALEREPLSVLVHLDELDVCSAQEHSEEWAELLSLALSEVPMGFVIAWCTAAEDRLPYEMFISFAARDLGPAFALAREHRIIVANVDALDDLIWLAEQPAAFQSGYGAACHALTEAFEVITPTTLKNQCLGIKAPPLVRNWAAASPSRSTATRSKSWSRRRSAAKTTTRTVYARKRPARRRSPSMLSW